MAVYKVIQDIEAEDKLLGPLSLKGFIYAAIAGILAFISIRLAIGGTPVLIKTVLIVAFLPPMILFGVLASPLGREQPTEVWLLSRVKFMLKNKQRTWDQSGTKQLVTITVPKKIETVFTKNLSKTEVSSRLQALANTLDSRGWAVKNMAVNVGAQPAAEQVEENSERLASPVVLTQESPAPDIQLGDDILDERNNEAAQNMQFLIDEVQEQRKQALKEQLESARILASKNNAQKSPAGPANENSASGLTSEEQQLLENVHKQENEFRLHPPKIIKGATREAVMTGPGQTVKLELANSGNDLSVASIARLANMGNARTAS